MPRTRKGTPPSYRLYKRTGQAVVTIDGHDYYLGPYGSSASRQKYAALIRSWEQRQERPPEQLNEPLTPNDRPTVNELILGFLKHASAYYRPHRGENKEAACIADALDVVGKLYGRDPADAFRPKDLKKVREAMVAKGWSRKYVNAQVARVKRMFRHAAEEDLIPGTVFHALLAVKGLRKGSPGVRETKKVRPVPVGDVKSVLSRAHQILKGMLLFSYWTGARPGEVCALKPCHLDRSKKVWLYHIPADADKTAHHGHELPLYVGPKAQRVLRPFLEGAADDEYVFSPVKEQQLRQAARGAARKTRRTPSEIRRLEEKSLRIPKIRKRDHYDPRAFRLAVVRLCDRAGVSRWSPNRLRHNAATRFRKMFGIEVARVLLRHRKLSTTEIYAETNLGRALGAAREIG